MNERPAASAPHHRRGTVRRRGGWRWFTIAVWAALIAFSLGCYLLVWILYSAY